MKLLSTRALLALVIALCLALAATGTALAGSGPGGGGSGPGSGGSSSGGGGGDEDDDADDHGGGGHGADDPTTTPTTTGGSPPQGTSGAATTASSATKDVRAAGRCDGTPVSSTRIRVRGEHGVLDVRFEIRAAKAGTTWHVAVVHEHRIAWKGAVRAMPTSGAIHVRRRLRDLAGSEVVTAHAWGPQGRGCRASIFVPA
jgi:hypothetical protein